MNGSDWTGTSEKILSTKHAPLCQQILKKGLTPTPLRGQIWSIVLGSEIEDHVSYSERISFDWILNNLNGF